MYYIYIYIIFANIIAFCLNTKQKRKLQTKMKSFFWHYGPRS